MAVSFSATGAGAGATYDWDLGSGLLKGKKDTITAAYSTAGKYTIIMVAHLAGGGTCTVQKDTFITVLPQPVPVMKVYPGTTICDIARQVTFIDSTANILSRQWVIESSSFTSQKVNYHFFNAARQDITLKVTDKNGCTNIITNSVFINDTVPVDFCANINIADINTVTAVFSPDVGTVANRTIVGYLWSFPGGTPSSYSGKTPPKISYPSATKTYAVSLTIVMKDGCTYTQTRSQFISPYISPQFISQCISKGLVVSGLGTGGRTNFQFSYPGAYTASPLPNSDNMYAVTYLTPGDYGMSISYDYASTLKPSGYSCQTTATYSKYITLVGPKASFTSHDNQLCYISDTVHFINTTVAAGATGIKYTWYLIDVATNATLVMGPTSTLDTFFIPHGTSSYNVALVAKSKNGCTDSTFSKAFITVASPTADFKLGNTSTCFNGDPVTLEAKPTPPEQPGVSNYKYYWRIISEADTFNQTPAYTDVVFFSPPLIGKYDVYLSVSNSHCSGSILKKAAFNVLGDKSSIILDDSLGCLNPDFRTKAHVGPESIYPPNLNIKPSYYWHASSNDANPVTFSDPTASTTEVVATSPGCHDILLDITIFTGTDTCTVTYKNTLCAGVPISFDIDLFKQDQTPALPWKCAGDTVNVNNTTDPRALSYKWSITPKGLAVILPNDTARNIKIVFKADTCYNVQLWANLSRNGVICSDSLVTPVCLLGPKPDFYSITPTFYCAPAICKFVNTSVKKQHTLVNPDNGADLMTQLYFWDFGDGTSLLTNNDTVISHVYLSQQKSSYDVTLTAFDTNFTGHPACSNTITKKSTITVTGPVPKFDMSARNGCDSLLVTFKNTSLHSKKSYFFDGDGGGADSLISTSHWYKIQDPDKDSIIFYPTLLSEDDTACRIFFRDSIKIFRTPKDLKITTDKTVGCLPFTVHFNPISRAATSWKWDLNNDGKIDDSTKTPFYTYSISGFYRARLMVTNHGYCPVTRFSDTLQAAPNASASFSISTKNICGSKQVKFTNTSKGYKNFVFDYGDGSPMDSDNIATHLYAFDPAKAIGDSLVFHPMINAYNAAGCSNIHMDTIVVYPAPQAGYQVSAINGCAPFLVNFRDTSRYGFGAEWDFDDDGNVDAYGKSVTHVFPSGVYSVNLRSFTAKGCVDTLLKTNLIRVNQPPVADFRVRDSAICFQDTAHFINLTQPSASVVAWLWKFNDPASANDTSTSLNPAYVFHSKGLHSITLMAVDDKGCTDTMTKKAIYVQDTLPPANTGLESVSVKDTHSVVITWQPSKVPLFKQYILEQWVNGIPMGIDTISTTQDTVANVVNPAINTSIASYCYSLRTMNTCGRVSAIGASHCTILLTGSADIGPVNTLSWSPYIGWRPNRYVIYREGNNGNLVRLDSVDGSINGYKDTSLCNEKYCYFIEAINDSLHVGSMSNRICLQAQYNLQSRPVKLRYATVINNNSINLSWDTIYYPRLAVYALDRYSKTTGWIKNDTTVVGNTFNDTRVDVNNESYTYQVRTLDKCGYYGPFGNPGTSILLSQNIENDKVSLKWNAYKLWPAGVKNYALQIQAKNRKYQTIKILVDTFFTDDSVYNAIDTAYCYRIVAHENGPDSSVSNLTCAVLPSRIFVPNAFTPGNKDSVNDVWIVSSVGIRNAVGSELTEFHVRVFNRWGMLVFESFDLHHGWDGTFRGMGALLGVYIYMIDAQGVDGKNIHLKGNVTLIK